MKYQAVSILIYALKLELLDWKKSLKKLKEASLKKGVDDVFSAALLGGLAGAAGGFALAAMMFDQLTKEEKK